MTSKLARLGVALVSAAACVTLAGGVAVAADPAPPVPTPAVPAPDACPPGYTPSTGVTCVAGVVGLSVTTENGVHAGVRVGDLLCVRVEAVSQETTADARVMVPCPVDHYPVFRDCDEARAAGAHDIPRGSPLYRKRLDPDNDGVACETETTIVTAPTPRPVTGDLVVTH